jgi:small-conductance mechanosensitive channel
MTITLHDLTQPMSQLLSWAPLARAALPLAALAWVVYVAVRWLRHIAARVRRGQGPWRGVALRLLPLASVAVVVAGLWGASRLLTATGAWLPVVALVGITLVGFAAGGFTLMRDVVMGIALILQRPFRVGDHIEVNTPEGRCAGEVHRVGLRAVMLLTSDGAKTYIPHSQMMAQVIVNKTPQAGVFPVSIRLTPPPTLSLEAARRLALQAAWVSRFASPRRPPEVALAQDAPPHQPTLIVRAFTHASALEGALRTDVTELFQEGAAPLPTHLPARPTTQLKAP